MASGILYADKLVTIDESSMRLHRYYFPFGSKRVFFSQINELEAIEPTLSNGKWRIWGTGDFRTWFPCDWGRPGRDVIFLMSLSTQSMRIGFTVMDSSRVGQLLRDKGLLK
jgi:hypothetical protein